MLADAGKMLFTALHSAADTGTFGLADKASAALAHTISPLTGQPMSYDEAYQRIQANNAKQRANNPVSAAVGDVGGMVVGAGKLVKAAKMIPGVGAALETLAPVQGQAVRNVAKAAVTGGLGAGGYTAADEAVRNGEINPTDVVTNTAIGAAVGPAASKIGTAIAKGVQSTSTKAMMLLASKLEEKPDVLQRAYDNFSAATGRVPTMAELVGMKSTGELSQLANDNPIIKGAANEAEATANAQRPRALAQTVEDNSGGPAQDHATLIQARKTRMDQAMTPIRNTNVGVDHTDIGLLDDPRVRSAVRADPNLSGRIRTAIQEVSDHGQSDSLTVEDIDSIRKSIRGQQAAYANPTNPRHNPHIAQQFGNLADNIAALGTSAEPAYQDALEQFGRDSDYIAGFKHGNAGKTLGEADKQQLIDSLATAEGRAGHQAGIASRVGDAAAAGNSGAARTAADLAEGGTGDAATLRQAAGQQGFSRIQEAANAEQQGARNLKAMSGNIAPDEGSSAAKHIGQATGAVAAHSPTTMVYHLSKAIPTFKKLSPAVQTQISRYLLNPQMTQQGINLLRRAGAKDAEIRNLAVALSASAGLNTGNALQP